MNVGMDVEIDVGMDVEIYMGMDIGMDIGMEIGTGIRIGNLEFVLWLQRFAVYNIQLYSSKHCCCPNRGYKDSMNSDLNFLLKLVT